MPDLSRRILWKVKVQGFLHEDSPFVWFFEKNYRTCRLSYLLERFYDQFDYKDIESFTWLSWIRDPKIQDKPLYSEEKILVIFRRNFYITIERHFRYVSGPHITQLFYRCEQIQDTVWVATLQSSGMFFKDSALQDDLRTNLVERNFYHSLKSAEAIIIL